MAIIIWSGTGLASLGVNWVGGVAPTSADTAQFDGTSVLNCTWDIATILAIDVQVAYSGIITQATDIDCTQSIIIDGGATQEWVVAGYDIKTGTHLHILALAAFDVSAGVSFIEVLGNTVVDDNTVCDFGASTLKHHGDIENATAANEFFNVISVVTPVPIKMSGRTRMSGLWSFEGTGIFEWNGHDMFVQGSDGMQMAGAKNVTFVYALGSLLTLRLTNTLNGGMTEIPGANYNIRIWLRRKEIAGTNTLKILGNVSLGVEPFLVGDFIVDLNGFTFAADRVDDFFGWYDIRLNGGTLTVVDELEVGHANTKLSGVGIVNAPTLVHAEGEIDVTDGVYNIGSYVPSAAAVLTGTGAINITQDFNLLDTATPLVDMSSVDMVFNAGTTQEYNYSGPNPPSSILVEKTGGVLNINDAQDSDTVLDLSALLGSATVNLLQTEAHDFKTIVTNGTGANETTIQSSTAGVKVPITFVSPLNPAAFYTRWKDTDVQGIIQNVDTMTGSDGGNNTIAGAAGLSFMAYIQPSDGDGEESMTTGVGIGIYEYQGI